jgi:hypothetical protein
MTRSITVMAGTTDREIEKAKQAYFKLYGRYPNLLRIIEGKWFVCKEL